MIVALLYFQVFVVFVPSAPDFVTVNTRRVLLSCVNCYHEWQSELFDFALASSLWFGGKAFVFVIYRAGGKAAIPIGHPIDEVPRIGFADAPAMGVGL